MAVNTWAGDAALAPVERRQTTRRRWWASSERLWALAFATPYVCVFVAFVIYPICYGLWLGSDPASYRQLLADPVYPAAVVNTLIYLLVAVNLKLFLALLLSGFFMRKGWWNKALLVIFILPCRTGDPGLYLDPLDAQRPVGLDQQYNLEPVPGRRPAMARQQLVCPRLRYLCAYLEMAAVLDHHIPRRAHGHPARAL